MAYYPWTNSLLQNLYISRKVNCKITRVVQEDEDKFLTPLKSPLGGKKEKSQSQDLGNLLHNKSHCLKAEDISETTIQK